jgi:hypothetical protein
MYDDKEAWEQFKRGSRLTKFGKLILKTKSARWYRDGTFFSPSMRWWHPLTWAYVLAFLIIAIPVCLLTNLSLKSAMSQLWEELTVNKFFKKHPEKLRWIDEELNK